jgi:hypothetical protein
MFNETLTALKMLAANQAAKLTDMSVPTAVKSLETFKERFTAAPDFDTLKQEVDDFDDRLWIAVIEGFVQPLCEPEPKLVAHNLSRSQIVQQTRRQCADAAALLGPENAGLLLQLLDEGGNAALYALMDALCYENSKTHVAVGEMTRQKDRPVAYR